MKLKMHCRLFILAAFLFLIFSTPVKAQEINYPLLYEWSRQPSNVQQNLVMQNTNIRVVDDIPYDYTDLSEVYGLTTLNVIPGINYVYSVDIQIKKGCEFALTHETGHALSNAGHSPYWWCYRPEFIQIWLQERDRSALLIGVRDDVREYFAEAYNLYIKFPQLLKIACPSTYNYITVVLRNT